MHRIEIVRIKTVRVSFFKKDWNILFVVIRLWKHKHFKLEHLAQGENYRS